MVVDSSALLAILFDEEDASTYSDALDKPCRFFMSSLCWFETAIVVEARKGLAGAGLFHELVKESNIECLPFDQSQAELALDAWRTFGKGRHPAGLNIGDCASYSLARTLHEPLLFKGKDFPKTDVMRAAT